jgi:hypothetical protein
MPRLCTWSRQRRRSSYLWRRCGEMKIKRVRRVNLLNELIWRMNCDLRSASSPMSSSKWHASMMLWFLSSLWEEGGDDQYDAVSPVHLITWDLLPQVLLMRRTFHPAAVLSNMKLRAYSWLGRRDGPHRYWEILLTSFLTI